jgi:hypothetical protein
MHIGVLVNTINTETINKILDYYNNNKEEHEYPLQRLNRAEGGFQIELPSHEWEADQYDFVDANCKIRQLRWCNRILTSKSYTGFTLKQTLLLYEAMVHILPGNVILEE